MNPMTTVAADVMTSPVHVLDREMDLREAVSAFDSKGISGAPVVDEEGRPVGVLTQTDVVHWYMSRDDELVVNTDFWHRSDLDRGAPLPGGFSVVDTNVPRVSDLMTPVVVQANATTPVTALAQMMVERRVHRVIITNDAGAVAGIVSAVDLLKLLAR